MGLEGVFVTFAMNATGATGRALAQVYRFSRQLGGSVVATSKIGLLKGSLAPTVPGCRFVLPQ